MRCDKGSLQAVSKDLDCLSSFDDLFWLFLCGVGAKGR